MLNKGTLKKVMVKIGIMGQNTQTTRKELSLKINIKEVWFFFFEPTIDIIMMYPSQTE